MRRRKNWWRKELDANETPPPLPVTLTVVVSMLSTVTESVVWTKKTRMVWDGKAKTEMEHLRLNVIPDYNSNI